MKNKILSQIGILAIILLSAAAIDAQLTLGGEVVELTDAKTMVIATPSGKMSIELQYIDVPEPEQPLHQIAKDHLQKLVLGKFVEFRLKGFGGNKTIGKVFLRDVDLSQQMLRDGAAWHVPRSASVQEKLEFDSYANLEALAKQEKRGVWSVAGLKPAWEVRAEKEEKRRQQEIAERERQQQQKAAEREAAAAKQNLQTGTDGGQTPGRPRSQGTPTASNNLDTWADVYAGVGREPVGLGTYYDPGKKVGLIYTSLAFVNLAAGSDKQKIECRAFHATVELPNGQQMTMYMLGFQAVSEDLNFAKRRSSLTVVADKQRIALGPATGLYGEMSFGAREIFFYKVSKASLAKIANAKNVEIKINAFSGTLMPESRELFKRLLAGT